MKQHLLLSALLTVAAGCVRSNASSVKVTNGVPTADFPSVVYIRSNTGGCTGTFIADDVLLTAAHCVNSIETRTIIEYQPVVIPSLNAVSVKVVAHPRYNNTPKMDLALAFFPKGTAPAISKIAQIIPKAGDAISVVGFGDNHYDDANSANTVGAGIKRLGKNTIKNLQDGSIELEGAAHRAPSGNAPTGEKSSVAHGDSGGPMFNANGDVIGVASEAGRQQGAAGVMSFHTDLTSSSSVAFLKENFEKRASPAEETEFVALCRTASGNLKETFLLLFEKAARTRSDGRLTADFTKESCKQLQVDLSLQWELDLNYVNSSAGLDPEVVRTVKDPNKVTLDVRPLLALSNLKTLRLANLGIEDASAFTKLPGLQTLDLDFNDIKDASPLAGLARLSTLSLKANSLASVQFVAQMPNLKSIGVSQPLRATMPKLLRETLAGKWADPGCEEDKGDGEDDKRYIHSTLDIDKAGPYSMFRQTTIEYGKDATCAEASLSLTRTLAFDLTFFPKGESEWFVNLNFISYFVTAHTDAAVEEYKSMCSGMVKDKVTACTVPPYVYYSLLKRDGDRLYFGEDDATHDGMSEATRHVQYGPMPMTLVKP